MPEDLYDNEAERKLHEHAIEVLKKELGLPREEISVLYERELMKLKEHAKVKDYLVVLACRAVKEILRRERMQYKLAA